MHKSLKKYLPKKFFPGTLGEWVRDFVYGSTCAILGVMLCVTVEGLSGYDAKWFTVVFTLVFSIVVFIRGEKMFYSIWKIKKKKRKK
jgi:hypothetical protein